MSNVSRFTVEREDDITIITLNDARLQDTLIVTELQDALLEFLEDRAPKKLIIDFRDVATCSTAVINGLLRVKTRIVGAEGQFLLSNLKREILEAFNTLNLVGSVFQVYEHRADAIAELKKVRP